MNWYLAVLKNYAGFNGRARRKEYWMFVLFNMIFAIIAVVLDNVLGLTAGELPYGVFYFLYAIAVLIPGLAVSVRRLHDVRKSGWMILISLIPLIGGIWLLVLMLTDGNAGENEYGPNPKEDIGGNEFKPDSKIETGEDKYDILVFVSIVYWVIVSLANFLIQTLVDNWYDTSAKYFQMGTNIIFAVIPIAFAVSVRNKKLKTIAIILSALISINILYGNIDWLIQELK